MAADSGCSLRRLQQLEEAPAPKPEAASQRPKAAKPAENALPHRLQRLAGLGGAGRSASKRSGSKEEGVNGRLQVVRVRALDGGVLGGQGRRGHHDQRRRAGHGRERRPSVGILLNDYSNGNDMVVARPGIKDVKALKGKKIGVEVGFVSHLLLINALKSAGLLDKDVNDRQRPTDQTPQLLKSGEVDAIVAWQPNSGQALSERRRFRAPFPPSANDARRHLRRAGRQSEEPERAS